MQKRHGLELDENLTMKDLGLPAYSGDRRKDGQFGAFLELIHDGNIPKGSMLLVESLDRLSRERVANCSRSTLRNCRGWNHRRNFIKWNEIHSCKFEQLFK